MNLIRWKPHIRQRIRYEDELLLKYWEEVGGLIFTEVHILTRRIDGIRFLTSSERDIVSFTPVEFLKATFNESLYEIIEVKSILNRGVIGQVIVGAVLLEMSEYKILAEKVRKVVVCGQKNIFLEEVCKKLGVIVWSPKD
jgi:hypothetical protein